MEEISLLVSTVIIVLVILLIILFFKLWGMTNDVKQIERVFFIVSIKPSLVEFIIDNNTNKAKNMMRINIKGYCDKILT